MSEIISAYTRAQAIEDGILVDLSARDLDEWPAQMCREAGILCPVAMTATAFHDCVAPVAREEEDGSHHFSEILAPRQDIQGRMWDVLWMFVMAVRAKGRNESVLLFSLHVVPNIPPGSNHHPRTRLVTLKAVIGGDDNGAPCITIMYPNED